MIAVIKFNKIVYVVLSRSSISKQKLDPQVCIKVKGMLLDRNLNCALYIAKHFSSLQYICVQPYFYLRLLKKSKEIQGSSFVTNAREMKL